MTDSNLPTPQDVLDAAGQIRDKAHRTPLLENYALNERTGGRVFFKPEILQVTGSFKFRGAYNRLSRMTYEERRNGVVAFSSGNHAQGVAAAAAMLGIPAVIVMPEDAPALKIRRTEGWGAGVVLYDRYTGDREAIARKLCEERGAVLVPSYDDPYIIAGQGTAALEIFQDLTDWKLAADQLLIPCGGGGLTAGSVLARDQLSQQTAIHTVEPEGYDDHARSFASGMREKADTNRQSICDALLSPMPGELTFAINRRGVAGGLVVTEAEVCAAVDFAFEELKLVVEPGGAVGLAAILAGKIPCADRISTLILSGGNRKNRVFSP